MLSLRTPNSPGPPSTDRAGAGELRTLPREESLRVLLVAEGSGGHVIPALEVAEALANTGARVKVWYAQRPQTASFIRALTQGMRNAAVDVDPLPTEPAVRYAWERLWQCGQLWQQAQRCFDTFGPNVVVGFGGWVSAPVVLAARVRGIGCLLHEQNVVMGRANRWLARWVDRVAVSFHETQTMINGTPSVMTGLPVRKTIGQSSQVRVAQRFGFEPHRPTLLILGGSQGAGLLNRLMIQVAALLSSEERCTWQVLHVAGAADEASVRRAYTAAQVSAWVAPFVVDMDAAYAQAHVVIARAGASTIAELARCGTPAILIPYPYAGGHQRANARVVDALGGGLRIEETEATPHRVLGAIRRLLHDTRLRMMMSTQIRALDVPDAAERLSQAIVELSRPHAN